MVYLPFADISINAMTIFVIGLMAGIMEGVFGSLASLLVVPALSIFGLPFSISASTNLGQSFGRNSFFIFKGSPSAFRRIGVVAGIAGLPGVFLGFRSHLYIAQTGMGRDLFLAIQAVLLLSAAVALYRQWSFFNRNHYYDDAPFPAFGLNWRFPLAIPGGSGLNCITLARVSLVGLLLGAATGFLGLGAGVLGVPLFMYILGLPLKNAAATDTVSMLIIASGALLCYAAAGRVEFAAVLILLAAVVLGSRIGSLLPGEIHLSHAKLAFSLMLAVAAVCAAMAAGLDRLTAPRAVLFIAGSAFCATLAVLSLVPERFWSGKISRLPRSAK